MQINDLNYLESIAVPNSVCGGALVAVNAYASASGVLTLTGANTNTRAIQLGNGGSIGFGRGRAIAVGDDPMAEVTVYGEGDKVIKRTRTHYIPGRDIAVARGFVLAIDLP
ncbi:MAG: hypothetical protein IGS54_08265 [Elainella sp. C42_A2020_010]|nr:hypothetical protein [Elainella sp. C42_A2020_010]